VRRASAPTGGRGEGAYRGGRPPTACYSQYSYSADSNYWSRILSVLTAIFKVYLGYPVLLELRMMKMIVTTGDKRQSNHHHQYPTFYSLVVIPAQTIVLEH